MAVIEAYHRVMAAYPARYQPNDVRFLAGAGGYSGAQFWKLRSPGGDLCLRRWPREHPSQRQLEFIQSVLWHVVQEGFSLVPLPLETINHSGYVLAAEHLWQLEPWMEGEANYWRAPDDEKLKAAMRALAELHVAASTFPLPDLSPSSSPGILRRIKQLRGLMSGGWQRIKDSFRRDAWPELQSRGEFLDLLFPQHAAPVLGLLEGAAQLNVPIQPCLRDIWHDHVLFVENRVAGFVDFGATRPDNVGIDVARLLGSLVGDDSAAWAMGLAAYQDVRALNDHELRLVNVFDKSTVLLAGVNWLDWVFCQDRSFAEPDQILARVDSHLARLANSAGR